MIFAPRVLWANLIATVAHWGQVRKVSREPYVNHPRRIERTAYGLDLNTHARAAALLHDVLEDTWVPPWLLRLLVSRATFHHVIELTDVFTHEAYPKWNRAKRKKAEADRLAQVSETGRILKSLDLLDNLDSFNSLEGRASYGDFVGIFGQEAKYLAASFVRGPKGCESNVLRALADAVYIQAQDAVEHCARARAARRQKRR